MSTSLEQMDKSLRRLPPPYRPVSIISIHATPHLTPKPAFARDRPKRQSTADQEEGFRTFSAYWPPTLPAEA